MPKTDYYMRIIKVLVRTVVMIVVITVLGSFNAFAEKAPDWTRKSAAELNALRTNISYEFMVFRTEDPSQTRLHSTWSAPLVNYLADKYDADPYKMVVECLSSEYDSQPLYRVLVGGPDATDAVLVRRVDTYEDVDYNTVSDAYFEFYQLFAIGEKNCDVAFDEFSMERGNNTAAAFMSIVPGVGQLYKGETGKGLALLGTGVAVAGCAVASHIVAVNWKNKMDEDPGFKDSWSQKAYGMRRQRNTLLVALGCLSAYSIFDAAIGEGVSKLTVSESDGSTISFAPSSESAGLALVVSF